MTTTQIIIGVILLLSYVSMHVLIFYRMRKANKETNKILEDILPPKEKEKNNGKYYE